MRVRTTFISSLSLLMMLIMHAEAGAGEFLFGNGFESGTTCAWSSSGCTVDFILGKLDDATTVAEHEGAILAALEKSLGSLPPEVHAAVGAVAELNAEFPDTKGRFLSISQAHNLATMSIDFPPTVQDALNALTLDVAQAYANPQAVENARIILMFSTSPETPAPLPLTPDTKLTVAGSLSYASWLAETFPSLSLALVPIVKISQAECRSKVRANQIAAISQIIVRNVAVVIFNIAGVILNSAEAIVNCTTGGATEIAGIVLDAVEGCVVGQFVSWVEVEADAECVGSVTGPPSVVDCVAGLVPCLGDIESVISSAIGVAQSTANIVNGVCTAINLREGLFAACDAGCPECSELDLESACGLSSLSACFDPLNAVPTVSCADLNTPECSDFGVPRITRVEGPTIVPDGGSVLNRVYFEDEDAGINWFSLTNVADSCGGCWLDNAWNPGVSLLTSGSFDFYWYCYCGGSEDFHATYHLRLYDGDGNESPPYTKQVSCSCSSSLLGVNEEMEKAGRVGGASKNGE